MFTTKISNTVHQNISKTYQFHVHFKISRLFFEYPSFLPLHSHPISPPLFYITSFILTSLQPGYSPLLPSLSHPISLLSHLSISLWPIARSLSHPFHRCSLPLCYPFSSVNPFPSVSRHYRSGERKRREAPPSHQGGRILHVLLPQAEVEHVEEVVEGEGVHSNDSVSLSNTYVHVLSAVVFRNVEDFMVRRGLTAKFFEDRLFYTNPDLFFPFILQFCKLFEFVFELKVVR